MFWGTTPALNILNELPNSKKKTVNILIFGCTDIRHVLKTISRLHNYDNVKLNFYMVERHLEQIGRQILLLTIALESQNKLGLFQKTRTFMEIYANSLLRPSVFNYLTNKSQMLVNLITNLQYCEKVFPIFKLNRLKYKERDYLENLFKFWGHLRTINFDIVNFWDLRLRRYLGTRYDSRIGAFDWDYHMRLRELVDGKIQPQEYTNWRNTGVAFTWIETESTRPNLSFSAGVLPQGTALYNHGYLGDIITGPFISYGIECNNQDLLKKANDQYIKRATDITEYNLMQYFYELANKEEFVLQNEQEFSGVRVMKINQNPVVDANCLEEKKDKIKYDYEEMIDVKNVEVNLISVNRVSLFLEQHLQFFDVLYIAHDFYEEFFIDDILKNLNSDCMVIVETKRFLVNLQREVVKKYEENVSEKAKSLGLVIIENEHSQKNNYVKFINEK